MISMHKSSAAVKSHPTGVRGLKCLHHRHGAVRYRVAPHWGAWIEIATLLLLLGQRRVAPHWGAWIEISTTRRAIRGAFVAPHWGAWIEIAWSGTRLPRRKVAPHWGAWIEIVRPRRWKHEPLSHPTGVRGLKYKISPFKYSPIMSHPTGVRGLKSHGVGRAYQGGKSHPTGVRGLKSSGQGGGSMSLCRTPLGCVD